MSEETMEQRIAKVICDLNRWNTPKEIKDAFGRVLSEDEIRIAMTALEAFVPYCVWIKTWHEQIGLADE